MISKVSYRGRFAPSPTGPLHLGSLAAALGSWLDARRNGGVWIVRMEDVDGPRCRRDWGEAILRSLAAHGMASDEPVVWQSARLEVYRAAMAKLPVYPCGCSRAALEGGRYPGTCRNGLPAGRTARCWRFRAPAGVIEFTDRRLGLFAQNVEKAAGDFVILRADGCFAYQLAVVADDIAQGITDVVRGEDLLDSTPRQILLYRALGVPPPRYLHLPLVVNEDGEKLSKQTLAPPLDDARAPENLAAAAAHLGFTIAPAPVHQMLESLVLNDQRWP